MQPLRGTKDLLPNEIIFWQYIYNTAFNLLSLSNYHEIRTPIIESTDLFQRTIGHDTDIINKEMYSFNDQSNRKITLRPEGTASIARSFISNKLYQNNKTERFWYFAPMFRYERPQHGRQRQFHQLGIECIGSINPTADVEVIRLANNLLRELKCYNFEIEINSIGNINERNIYKKELMNYLFKYKQDLDHDSQKRLYTNPLRILDSKNENTQNIISNGPSLKHYLQSSSLEHFHSVCKQLNYLNIKYQINDKLIRGLDYYNDTAFEIKTKSPGNQNTICGGGRYDSLIQELGGPNTPSVGWAIGIERLLLIIKQNIQIQKSTPKIYIATQGKEAQIKSWEIINTLEKEKIHFELNLENNSFQKQIKKADKSGASICIILGENEIINKSITLKILNQGIQKTIFEEDLITELRKLKIS